MTFAVKNKERPKLIGLKEDKIPSRSRQRRTHSKTLV